MALERIVADQGFAVLDGGFATSLEATGYVLDKHLWSGYAPVDNPKGVVEVHRQFLNAGADIITSCSYQMSYDGFSAKGMDLTTADKYFMSSTQLAISAVLTASRPALVAASIGTFGAHLSDGSEYSGQYGLSVKELVEWHRPKFEVLAASGADVLACETVPCINEVKAFQELIVSASLCGGAPTSSWVSMACRSSNELNSGERLEDAVRAFEDPAGESNLVGEREAKNISLGINCTSPELVADLLCTIKDTSRKSRIVVVYPNSGEAWDGISKKWCSAHGEHAGAEFDTGLITLWREQGASVIGGCCRCSPATISGIRRFLESEHK